MRLTYDPNANAAYVRLVERIQPGESRRQELTESGLVLDWDDEGRLLGVEVLDARRMLRAETLAAAVRRDWVFSVREVSAGVYEASGKDGAGRTVSTNGTDPDALLIECHRMAKEIDDR